jgi:hypothetical protein
MRTPSRHLYDGREGAVILTNTLYRRMGEPPFSVIPLGAHDTRILDGPASVATGLVPGKGALKSVVISCEASDGEPVPSSLALAICEWNCASKLR